MTSPASPHQSGIEHQQIDHSCCERPDQHASEQGHFTNIITFATFGSTPIDKQAGPAIKGAT